MYYKERVKLLEVVVVLMLLSFTLGAIGGWTAIPLLTNVGHIISIGSFLVMAFYVRKYFFFK